MTIPTIPGWSVESLYDDRGLMLREDRVLYDSQTEHQRLRVFENSRFGRVMTLDGVIQVTEADEFIYHEMLAHVPILAHGEARRVLIIGGGDGGMAREVLRHRTVEHVTMVEIDAGVVEFAKEYLPALSAGAFDDPRLDLVIADGAEFVKTCEDRFDVIIVDSTDPIGPGEVLFGAEFYRNCKRCLTENGILATQNGCPFLQRRELVDTHRRLGPIFADAGFYVAPVPSYIGGFMAFGWATMDEAARRRPGEVIRERFERAGIETGYYNPDIHLACFALPDYIRALMA